MRILFIAATHKELNYINQSLCSNNACFDSDMNSIVFNCKTIGIGQSNVETNLPIYLDSLLPDYVVLFGSAGALCSNIRTGSFYFPNTVSYIEDEKRFDFILPTNVSFFSHWIQDIIPEKPVWGSSLTIPHFIASPSQKILIHNTFNVSTIDMESFFVVKLCSARSVPVLIMRIIIDDLSGNDMSISDYLKTEELVFSSKKEIIGAIAKEIFARLSHLTNS